MDLGQALSWGGFAGIGGTIGRSLAQTGAINGLSKDTAQNIIAGNQNNSGVSLSTKIIIGIGLTLIGITLVKRLV